MYYGNIGNVPSNEAFSTEIKKYAPARGDNNSEFNSGTRVTDGGDSVSLWNNYKAKVRPLPDVTNQPPVYYNEIPLLDVTNQPPVYYNEYETGNIDFNDSRETIEIKAQDSDGKTITTKEIQNSIKNLKAGEKYEYFEHYSLSGEEYSQPVVWIRNSDNTLIKQEQIFNAVPEGYKGKTTLETHYASDGKTKLSEEKTNVIGNTRYVSTETFKGGKRIGVTTNFADAIENVSGDSKNSGVQYVKYLKDNAGQFSSNEINDQNGNTILTYKDGKFFDEKGVETDETTACEILEHASNNNMLGNLVQTYAKQNIFGNFW